VTIGSDGTVSAVLAGASAPTTIGSLTLASFINPAGLEATGSNLLVESAASGAPTVGTPGLNGLGTLLQGSVEQSNVNVVQELVSMIETQRAYEMNSKSVQTSDQMLGYLTQNL
jgi:flagellar basal-body rod protein FlgG